MLVLAALHKSGLRPHITHEGGFPTVAELLQAMAGAAAPAYIDFENAAFGKDKLRYYTAMATE